MSFTSELIVNIWLTAVAITVITLLLSLLLYITRAARKRAVPTGQAKRANDLKTEAFSLLGAAEEQAERIIREAKLFNRQISGRITHTLSQEGSKAQETITLLSQQLVQESARQLKQYVAQYQQSWETTLSEFQKESAKQLALIRGEMNKTMAARLSALHQELDQFKHQEEQKITKRLQTSLPKVIGEIIGRSIPLAVHEDLVRGALEKAYHNKTSPDEPANK